MKRRFLPYLSAGAALVLICTFAVLAQSTFTAFDVPTPVEGNHHLESHLGIANDFEVLQPITVSQVGVFDHKGDGIQGATVLKVRLYAGNPDRARKRASAVLLETVLFDAADPGKLVGGFRYKPLLRPVTLIPGQYTITAENFDDQNPDYKKPEKDLDNAQSLVALNDGSGRVRFTGTSHYHIGKFLQRTRTAKDSTAKERAPNRYGAATFVFSPAAQYDSPFAADYSALTSGARSFSWDTNKLDNYSYRYGSLSVLEENAFPVLVEPSGSRIIFEAAGYYGNNLSSARCVAFSDEQWGLAPSSARSVLFENAIKWASRKADNSKITVGLSTNMNADNLLKRGFQVLRIDSDMNVIGGTAGAGEGCDVLVVDFRGQYTEEFVALALAFAAHGGGLVVASPPAKIGNEKNPALFEQVNGMLRPFGIAFRYSAAQLNDFGVTNIPSAPYPPTLFNAYPAANLLRRNRLGQAPLTSLEKVVALNTMSYSADGRADLLSSLATAYAGSVSGVIGEMNGNLGSFSDSVVLSGAQANDKFLGQWKKDGNDLVSVDTRGSVEYDFEATAAGAYRIQVFGVETLPKFVRPETDLILSVDDIPVGQCGFQVPYGTGTLLALFGSQLGQYSANTTYQTSDHVECVTPFLTPGRHKLKVFWNNPRGAAQLRLQQIRVQSAVGPDADGDGLTDWVRGLVDYQSGMDVTNATMESYTSPVCIEGRDPFPSLMDIQVSGAEKGVPSLVPAPAPNARWFANVPLAEASDTTLQVSYQQGAKLETRKIRWLPVNVLNGGTFTLRDGDSLLLSGSSQNEGTMEFTIGTNRFIRNSDSPMPYVFTGSGIFTVTGTCSPANGAPQTGSITVKVIQHGFNGSPACHVGEERDWEVSLPPEVTLETDQRLMLGQLLEGESRISLTIDQSEPRYFLSRIGASGPVLGSGVARGFDFWSGKNTMLRGLKRYPDGSDLVEMMIVLNPVLPDITVQVDVFVGGVVFDDGTTTKQLTKSDFDAAGRCFIRFIHPPNFKPAVCHTITLRQGDAVIGHVW